MRFGVLGPLTVSGSPDEADIRAAKQRLLLAMLLTRPGQPVSVDRLAEALWNGEPPADVSRSVAWHVHKLRKVIGAQRVQRISDGYLIDLTDDAFDARDFESLYRAGCRATDPARAAGSLAEGLALWRGPAFGDLADLGAVREEATRLDAMRLMALERRVDVDLELGRHADLIGELTVMLGEHPASETIRAQLMLSLYRCGRQADALRIYREGRRLLRDDYGMDPGTRLRRLEQAILRNDPELDPPPVDPAAPARAERAVPEAADQPSPPDTTDQPVPAELPADLGSFTGRAAEVARLESLVRKETVVIPVITGIGGAGKSTLSVHIAHRLAAEFPDGQLYVNLRGADPAARPVEPAAVLARFLRSLGVGAPAESPDAAELSARFRSATTDKRLLILLDDARDADQVRPLLPSGGSCRVIVTSRSSLATLNGALPLRLGPLPAPEASQMLWRLLGECAADDATVAEIARLCGHLPLALSVAAARLRRQPRQPAARLAERLSAERDRLSVLRLEDKDVRASFRVSYLDLDDPAAERMFRLLGLHAGAEVSLPVAAALADLPMLDTEDLLETLVDACLLECREPERYRGHDLLRLFARELLSDNDSDAERRAAEVRMARCYLSLARHALEVRGADLNPGTDPRIAAQFRSEMAKRVALNPPTPRPPVGFGSGAEARRWVDREFGNLLALMRNPGAATAEAAALPATVLPLLIRRDRVARMREPLLWAADLADRDGDPSARFHAHYDLGNILSRHNAALAADHYAEAGRAAGDARDPEWEAMAQVHRAEALVRCGCAARAIDILRACVKATRESGDPVGESGAWIGLAAAHRQLDERERALDDLRRAVTVAREGGHDFHHAEALDALAQMYIADGRAAEALPLNANALQLVEAMDLADTNVHAVYLWTAGEALEALGRDVDARVCRLRALEILKALRVITPAEALDLAEARRPHRPRALSL